MTRNTWKPSLALGALFALCGAATASDRDTMLLSGGTKYSAATMTLGGSGTAAQAATEDTELTHGYKYRGYYGWGGGYGYRGYWGGGWNHGWGGYGWNRGWGGWGYPRTAISFNFYRPRYYGGWGSYSSPAFYSTPLYYSSYYSYRSFPIYSSYYYDCGPSFYLGIAGGTGSGAPAVTLGGNFAPPSQPAQPMAQPVAPEGTFPYDGGPANPVPLPQAEPNATPQPIPPAAPSADLPVSGKAKPGLAPAKSPYKYKAYGEK